MIPASLTALDAAVPFTVYGCSACACDLWRVGSVEGGWIPMRTYADDDEVDFAIVGTGAGGGTLTYKLASAGFRVVAFDAGTFWRPLEDFASDEKEQQKLYWR